MPSDQYLTPDPPADPGYVWRECVCAEIDPSDRPCVVCEAKEERREEIALGLRAQEENDHAR